MYGVLMEGISVHFVLIERHKNAFIIHPVFPQYTRYGGGEICDLEQRAVHLQVTSQTQQQHINIFVVKVFFVVISYLIVQTVISRR